MKIYFLTACLCISLSTKAQTDAPLDVPGIGHGATSSSSTFRFNYLGKPVAHYGLGWYSEDGTPSAYLSGYAGLKFFTSGGVRMVVGADGNVGIGTIDPRGYKLAVAGNIIAESIKVQLQSSWPDYVFAKDYDLPSLQETEKHIKEKGHLPGIPSAAEVKVNGVDLGEMNAKLLQKIEELTLHLIELKKENAKQREDINELKSKHN